MSFKESAMANDCPIEHSLIIIDDFANDLKDKELCQKINKAIVKLVIFVVLGSSPYNHMFYYQK